MTMTIIRRRREKQKHNSGRSDGGEVVNNDGDDGADEREDEGEDEDLNGGSIIKCGIILCGDAPNADPDVFRAANNSGLVYDGRLVVDPNFNTTDCAILAGGTLTKFSRAYGADTPRHEMYNAREVCTARSM